MKIRNGLLALSLVSMLPAYTMATDKVTENAAVRRQDARQNRACRALMWGCRLSLDAAGTVLAGMQYKQCEDHFGALPIVKSTDYLSDVARECRAGDISAMGLGGIAVISDIVGLCAAITGNERLEAIACNVSFGGEALALASSVVAWGGLQDADRTFSPHAAIEADVDTAREWGAGPLAAFGFTTLYGAISRIKACCARTPSGEPRQPQQQQQTVILMSRLDAPASNGMSTFQ